MFTQTNRFPMVGLAAAAVVLTGALGLGRARAAESVTEVFVVQVSPAMDQAFREGVKTWEECLTQHGETRKIEAYDAASGDLDRYAFIEAHATWGGLDVHSAAGKACQATFSADVNPYTTDAGSEFLQPNAKVTYMPGGQGRRFHQGLCEIRQRRGQDALQRAFHGL
jgi:hypothetical protein